MDKIEVKLTNKLSQYVKVKIPDKDGVLKEIRMHGYLVGMETAFALKKKNKLHNLVIITGNVGAGKSTLIQGEAALNSVFNNQSFSMDNISWATDKFIEKTDREDNIGSPQIWDEAIQGASARNMAISNMGNKLKMAFVTKRFKEHTYYLLIDELNEYAWKLIKMADAWINVRKFYVKRGYFDVYTNKRKIKFLYNAFKLYNKTWDSQIVRSVNADCRGKFDDFTDLFIDDAEYNRLKLEETKQLEENGSLNWDKRKALAFHHWTLKLTHKQIMEKCGCTIDQIKGWSSRDFKSVVGGEKIPI